MDPRTRYLPALEEEMRRVLGQPEDAPELLYGMLHYHLGWVDRDFQPAISAAGKRLRPILLFLVCEAQGGDWRKALPAAASIELLHNFTLIHDDIEDGDHLRRGRPTLWSIWRKPQAINAGDALFALAYRGLLDLDTAHLSPDLILRITQRYTETILNITEGQCLDIGFETENIVAEATYLTMVKYKTAALIGLACELGGMIASAPTKRIGALREFGEALGIAFQMQDDLLGLWGNPDQTGKPAGPDLRNHKKSLPILHGIANSANFRALLMETEEFDDQTVQQGLKLLESAGSRAYTQTRALTHHEEALAALKRAQGEGEALAALHALTAKLLNRTM